eukprot:365986-Chlamydomonas_euryale.AAC.6
MPSARRGMRWSSCREAQRAAAAPTWVHRVATNEGFATAPVRPVGREEPSRRLRGRPRCRGLAGSQGEHGRGGRCQSVRVGCAPLGTEYSFRSWPGGRGSPGSPTSTACGGSEGAGGVPG